MKKILIVVSFEQVSLCYEKCLNRFDSCIKSGENCSKNIENNCRLMVVIVATSTSCFLKGEDVIRTSV